jgi:YARHG domain/Domain of unknown function (DUF4424)
MRGSIGPTLLVLVLFTLGRPARANDTAFGGSATRPYPVRSSEVEMVSEKVELKLIGLDRWEVRCHFVFRNATNKAVALRMGFPFPANEGEGDLSVPRGLKAPKVGRPVVWRFSATVRGKPAAARLRPLAQGQLKARFGVWAYIWQVRLRPRERLEVHNSFVLGVTATSMAFMTEVSYLLRSGGSWRGGRIGRSRITVRSDQPFLPCSKRALQAAWFGKSFDRSSMLAGFATPAQPPGFRVLGSGQRRRIVWDLRNFAPQKDLRVCIVPARIHTQWLDFQLDSNVDEFKLSAAQLRVLANYYFAKHGKIFKSADLRRFFGGKWWYRSDPAYSAKRLSEADWSKVKHVRAVLKQVRSRGHDRLD